MSQDFCRLTDGEPTVLNRLALHGLTWISLGGKTLCRVESGGRSPNAPSGIRTGGERDGLLGTAAVPMTATVTGNAGLGRQGRRAHSCTLTGGHLLPGQQQSSSASTPSSSWATPSSGLHPSPPRPQHKLWVNSTCRQTRPAAARINGASAQPAADLGKWNLLRLKILLEA